MIKGFKNKYLSISDTYGFELSGKEKHGKSRTALYFASPKEAGLSYEEKLSFVIFCDIGISDKSLDDYLKGSVFSLKRLASDVEVIETNKLTIGGLPAVMLRCNLIFLASDESEKDSVSSKLLYWIEGVSCQYHIMFTGAEKAFERYNQTIYNITDSIQFNSKYNRNVAGTLS
jgi:hypothetical protein